MIIEYHRPDTLEEALDLLAREQPLTIALGGGTAIDRKPPQEVAVVDLQALGLDTHQQKGISLHLGATLTLQNLLDHTRTAKSAHEALSQALGKAIQHEAAHNLRQVATIAGTLIAADGRSPFATLLLALDARLNLEPDEEQVSLGDLLPLRGERLRGRLITEVVIPLNVEACYEYVARSPADRPIVCVGLAVWPSGRTRLALGGSGASPSLAFDGGETDGLAIAARSAYDHAQDEWASAEYRREIAGVLAERCLQNLVQGD